MFYGEKKKTWGLACIVQVTILLNTFVIKTIEEVKVAP